MRSVRVLAGVAAILLAGLAPVLAGAPAEADTGPCQESGGGPGVTVVVDLSDLGGGVQVGCAGTGPMNGVQALQQAGFSVTGTALEGLAFVCRIAGRPAPDEALTVGGHSDYRELCATTPPLGAYWSYWYAGPDGDWTYATTGPSGHEAIPGGYEGWRFELNRPQAHLVPPSFDLASDPPASPGSAATSAPSASVATTSPAATRAGSGQGADPGSPWPTLAALAGATALVVGGGVVSWRRSRAR